MVKFSIYLNRRVFVMSLETSTGTMICITYLETKNSNLHNLLAFSQTSQCLFAGYHGSAQLSREQLHFITKTCLFKYTENFPIKKWKFSDKNFWYFSYFCSKHRLWVLVRSPQWGGSNGYPQSMFLSRNIKNNVYPCKPQFYYIKVGFKGVKTI